MKNLYYWCKTACMACVMIAGNITVTNVATAQTNTVYPNSVYTPVYVGKIIPNHNYYSDNRHKTTFVYDQPAPDMRLPEPVIMRDFYAMPGNGGVQLRWRTTWEPDNLKFYEIEYSTDGIVFQQAGVMAAGNYLNGKAYDFRHFPVNVYDRLFYRVRIVDENGRFAYSRILPVAATLNTKNYIFPTVENTGIVSLYLNDSFRLVQLVNMEGRILKTLILNGRTGRIDIPLSKSAEGICIVRVISQDPQKNIVQKIFVH